MTGDELKAKQETIDELAILHSVGDGIIATDKYGKILLMNKIAEAVTGWCAQDSVGRHLDEVFHIFNGKTQERYENLVANIVSKNCSFEITDYTIITTKDGAKRVIAGNGAPIHRTGNEIAGAVLTFRDVTEKRKMEEELLKIQKLESIGVLAGGIAHDFNNILTAVMGNISLAKMYTHPRDIIERLEETEKSLVRARELTQQLLTFSKDRIPNVEPTSIVELLRHSANFVLSGSNVKCQFSLPDDLWTVEIDEGQIGQVISNIIINADQAMPEGGVVEIKAENIVLEGNYFTPLKAGKYIKVSIKDHGIGIPEQNIQRIFDPYFTTKKDGSGLGLAVSHSIIKKHNGYISVESTLGIGTTFHIYLPAYPEKTLKKRKEQEEKLVQGKGKILVVDDEESIRDLACKILNNFGYEVIVADDGRQAVDLYKSAKDCNEPFDAVIVDLTIPGGMGGRETIQKLTQVDPKVKAIVSSGYSNDPIMIDFKKHGFCGVIRKPYGVRELSGALNSIVMTAD